MKVKAAMNDKVLVVRDDSEKYHGGDANIAKPDAHVEKALTGVVAFVGPGLMLPCGKRSACVVEKGDKVLFGPAAGRSITVGQQEYQIMAEDEIEIILEEGDATP